MTRKLTINGKEYKAKDIDFNALCYFERSGIDMNNIEANNFNFIRSYCAYCMNVSPEEAGTELYEEVKVNGWDALGKIFNDVLGDMTDEGFSETGKKARPKKIEQ